MALEMQRIDHLDGTRAVRLRILLFFQRPLVLPVKRRRTLAVVLGGSMIRLLEKLFPPKLGRIDGVLEGHEGYEEPEEQGWAGNVQERPYRDGIDRTLKEERT